MEKQQHHDDAGGLHDIYMQADAAEPGIDAENHRVAARQEQHDRGKHPGEETLEHPQP
jgi:hypothetical protein